MRLLMAGIDCPAADAVARDAFPSAAGGPTAARLRGMAGGEIAGIIPLVGGDAAEVYVSYRGDLPPDGGELLCRALDLDPEACREHCAERYERQAATHLMRAAIGMASALPDRKRAPLRRALETAREAGTADPLLEALFRCAIDAGERAADGAGDPTEDIVREAAARFDRWRRERLRPVGTGSGEPDFPLFVSLRGVDVLIAGGGAVAARRAETLIAFGARVHVAAPEISPALAALAERGAVRWSREEYRPGHLDGAALAVAATDRREVNRQIGLDAGERGIPVSVADDRRECTFYFPAVARSGRLTAGLISNNGDHAMLRRAAARLRKEMDVIDANCQSGKPREPSGHRPDRPDHGCDTPGAS